jgi:hypothetical protein
MIRKVFLFGAVTLLFSFNNSINKIDAKVIIFTEPITQEDTIEIISEEIINPIQSSIYNKVDTTFFAPFSVDSIFIGMVQNNDNNIDSSTLTRGEVLFLTTSINDYLPNTYLSEYFNHFNKLDSLIINNKYNEYIDQLDIGMIKICNAYINGQLKLSTDLKMILWSLNYSTYEACPYTSGTKIIGTLFYNENITNTIQIGEISGGGDAPMYWDTEIYSLINKQQMTTHLIYIVGEMEEEDNGDYIEFKDTTYHINISNSGFEVIGQTKD